MSVRTIRFDASSVFLPKTAETHAAGVPIEIQLSADQENILREHLGMSSTETEVALHRAKTEATERIISEAIRARIEAEVRVNLAMKWLDAAQQKVNDNPANGPGAPSIPGLAELRTAMLVLRTGDP